jgi:hypothetical protein
LTRSNQVIDENQSATFSIETMVIVMMIQRCFFDKILSNTLQFANEKCG